MKEFELYDGTMVSQEEYLYGIGCEIEPIPAEITVRRVELIDDVIEEIQNQNYLERDMARMNSCLKAKKHWQSLGE